MSSTDNIIVTEARKLHEWFRLAGSTENELLTLSDGMIVYLVMMLRRQTCRAPECSVEEWTRFLELLRPHWISSMLYWNILHLPGECRPPDPIMNVLQRSWLHAEMRTLQAFRQTRQVTEGLESAGIPVLLLKGPALAGTVYPAAPMRQYSDIDMLISYDDMKGCEIVMEKLGYRCPVKLTENGRHSHHHQNFYPDRESAGPFAIEMHWRLDCGFGLYKDDFLEGIFSRSIRIELEEVEFSTLSHEDHLLYQSFHLACQHCHGTRLSWIADIAMLAGQITEVPEWQRLIHRSVEGNCRNSLEAAIRMASFWTDLSLPTGVSDTTLWPGPSETEEKTWPLALKRSESIPAFIRLSLQALPDNRDKMRFLFRFVFPHPGAMHNFRRGRGLLDVPMAYFRRWLKIFRYI